MVTRKKKKAALGFGGMALAFMGLFALKGSGGGTTPPPPTGTPLRTYFRNVNENATTYLTREYVGDTATDIANLVLSATRENEYRDPTLYTEQEYYIYARGDSGPAIAQAQIGTVSDGPVIINNAETFNVLVNGASVGTKTGFIEATVGSTEYRLLARIAFAQAVSSTSMITQRAFT